MAKKIVAISGSIRSESYHVALAKYQVKLLKAQGYDAEYVDLADYDLPIYNGDIEAKGIPENARKLKEIFKSADAILIASPEYNSGYSPLLKNTIDWISRPSEANEPPLVAFSNKIVGLTACSPGALGGLRGLTQLRILLSNINMIVLPQQVAIPNHSENIHIGDVHVTNETYQKMINGMLEQLKRFL